jgi:hypothetical protein
MIIADLNTVIQGYLNEILSIPTVILVIFFTLLFLWRDDLGKFIRDLFEIKIGGLSLKSQQQDQPSPGGPGKSQEADEKIKQLRRRLRTRTEDKKSREAKIKDQEGFINYLLDRLKTTEYRYLSYHLVPHTKEILRSLDVHGPLNIEGIRLLPFMSKLPPTEIEAIISVLTSYGLAVRDGDSLKITAKGSDFVTTTLT